MQTEDFTAVAMCPRCSAVAVHGLAEPRKRPADRKTPSTLVRVVGDYEIHTWGGPRFDPVDAVVARVCQCGHRWGQK